MLTANRKKIAALKTLVLNDAATETAEEFDVVKKIRLVTRYMIFGFVVAVTMAMSYTLLNALFSEDFLSLPVQLQLPWTKCVK